MNITLPYSVQLAIQLLNNAGYEAYVVGGCVRDSLMGKSPYDWDITTSALPAETLAVFTEYRTIETGLRHGTITVIIDELPLEITTYRVDGNYTDGRHPDAVTFTPSLTEDLRRRDFTVNAMAYHPNLGLVDLFGGQKDMERSIVRCVGNPKERFQEDALRMIRGLRFAATLGFSIDNTTGIAIHQLCNNLSIVSAERITAELKKLLCGNYATDILAQFSDVIAVFLPEIGGIPLHVHLSDLPPLPHVRLAALFRDANIDVNQANRALQRLKFDSKTIKDVTTLLTVPSTAISENDAKPLRLLQHLGPELIWDYYALNRCDAKIIKKTQKLLDTHACYKISMLAINGQDLISLGMTPGPEIGCALNALLDAVINGACENTRQALLSYLEQ